jgi:hypothetical protein
MVLPLAVAAPLAGRLPRTLLVYQTHVVPMQGRWLSKANLVKGRLVRADKVFGIVVDEFECIEGRIELYDLSTLTLLSRSFDLPEVLLILIGNEAEPDFMR